MEREWDPDGRGGGEELGRTEGGETIIKIYYVKEKKSTCNKRKEKKKSGCKRKAL